MKILAILLGLSFLVTTAFGQTTIYGKVTDIGTGEEVVLANITVSKNDTVVIWHNTDFEGNYSISLDPGTYDMSVTYAGYPDYKVTGVVAHAGEANLLDLEIGIHYVLGYHIYIYTIPYSPQETSTGHTMDAEQIREQPTKKINELILSAPGVSGNYW